MPQPGPVGQVGRLSETVIAFARSCSCGIETVVAFACLYLCGIETAIAFAGEKWAVLVQFSGAEVMVVSMVAVQGRAVVLSVSSRHVVAPLARKSSPSVADVCVSAKKFALRAHNGSKLAFLRLLGELFAEMLLKGLCWASFFAPIGPAPRSCRRRGARGWLRVGGFAALEAGWRRIAGRVRTSNDAISPVW